MELRWISEKWDYGFFKLQFRKTKKSAWEYIPTEGPMPPLNSAQERPTPKCWTCSHKQKWHDAKGCNAPLPEKTKCPCTKFKEIEIKKEAVKSIKQQFTPVKKTETKYDKVKRLFKE